MFIEEFPDAVSPELCERLIAQFESDERRKPSVVLLGSGKEGIKSYRTGTTVEIDYDSPAWKGLMSELAPAIHATLGAYVKKHPGLKRIALSEGLVSSKPRIERVEPGQGFDWHVDHGSACWQSAVAGLLYLKAVHDGGGTEFADQNHTVMPTAGKIVLFPPYWTHFHRGVTPTRETKYVLSYFWDYKSAYKMK